MAKIYENKNCSLYGTRYCAALNSKSCKDCFITEENAKDTAEWIDEIDKLLPPGGVSHLFTGDKCLFCKGESKNRASCYAMVDVGNALPVCTKKNFLGKTVKTQLGSMLPLQISCCDECRKKYSALGNSHMVKTVVIAAIMIALLNITRVMEAVASVAMWLPLALYALTVGGSFLLARHIRSSRMKAYAPTVYLDIMDIPQVAELKNKGWFELSPYKDMSKPVFDSKLLQQGLYTAAPETTREENI